MADHSHKWHNEKGDTRSLIYGDNSLSHIIDKLKNMNYEMDDLRDNVLQIHPKSNKKFYHEEETFERYLDESAKMDDTLDQWIKLCIENTNKNLQRHDSAIKNLEERIAHLAHILAIQKIKHDKPVNNGTPTPNESNPVRRLGLGNPEPVNMVIDMADRSMQSPKGIVENVLVKIHKFIFPVDFVILDIVEDDKVIDELGGPKNLEEIEVISFSPSGLSVIHRNSFGKFQDSDNMSISNNDFVKGMDELWDDLDSGILTNVIVNPPLKPEFLGNNMVGVARNLYVFVGSHTFLSDFIILENITEFIEKGSKEVLAARRQNLRPYRAIIMCLFSDFRGNEFAQETLDMNSSLAVII
ncbi:hypothetical protein Tco_1058551 [Tanacetum coccineum]|uniref:Uncharacterized protein n=1 Tax=Tanacetum coccineum TaxID=301880 RepID=A0ABQ5H9U8_9ASTR